MLPEMLVVFCNCQSRCQTDAWKQAAEILADSNGINMVTFTDLCGCCVAEPRKVAAIFGSARKILMVACHPRAVQLLLDKAGITAFENIQWIDLLASGGEELVAALNLQERPEKAGLVCNELVADPSWPAWYPVIDSSRCTNCGQCADFCLFGVYRKEADRVTVVNPQACKNNCPACARICPQVAIVFPKYAQEGPISGSGSFDEMKEMERHKLDVDNILGGDIYHALEQRKLKRRSIIREQAMQKALSEREDAQNHSSLP